MAETILVGDAWIEGKVPRACAAQYHSLDCENANARHARVVFDCPRIDLPPANAPVIVTNFVKQAIIV